MTPATSGAPVSGTKLRPVRPPSQAYREVENDIKVRLDEIDRRADVLGRAVRRDGHPQDPAVELNPEAEGPQRLRHLFIAELHTQERASELTLQADELARVLPSADIHRRRGELKLRLNGLERAHEVGGSVRHHARI